ncbi:MAG: hypothetical protein ACOYBQ_05925 [Fluviibacter sp.]|jgi:hypothetical protein
MAVRFKSPAFDPRLYPEKLPYMAKLREYQELGNLNQVRYYKERFLNEIAAERPIKAKLQKSDYRARKYLSELFFGVSTEDSFVPSSIPSVASLPGSLVAGLLFNSLPKPVDSTKESEPPTIRKIVFPKRPTGMGRIYSSRAGAGAKLNSATIKSLRTRTWFNSLLGAMSFGMGGAYVDAQYLRKSRSTFLRTNWARSGHQTQSDLIERGYDKATANSGIRFAALDLYKRDYENGTGRPSAKTLFDLDQVFPGTAQVYERGFYEIPIWEIFDGNLVDCQSFLSRTLPDFKQGLPDQWAQYILDLALVEGSRQRVQPFVDGNNFYGFNSWLGTAMVRSVSLLDLKFANLAMALIAVYQIFDSTKLLPTKSIQWVISAFSRIGLYRHFFGSVVDEFVKTTYLKGLPVFKI